MYTKQVQVADHQPLEARQTQIISTKHFPVCLEICEAILFHTTLSGSSGRYHSSQTADYPKKKSDCMIMWRKSAFTKPFWGRTLLSPRFCTLLTNVYKKKSGKTISLYRLALKSFAWFYYCTVRSVVYCITVLVALFTRYSTADGSQLPNRRLRINTAPNRRNAVFIGRLRRGTGTA